MNTLRLLSALDDVLPPDWTPVSSPVVDRLYSVIQGDTERPTHGPRKLHLVFANTRPVARERDRSDALRAFESDLQLYVAEMAPEAVFVHAGVVGWHGRAIVIPGRSFSGKTTLVAALVRAGATYYSDEYAVFDNQGRVAAYPRPLVIRDGPEGAIRRQPVETFGGVTGTTPLALGTVVCTRYQAGTRWHPHAVPPGRGAVALLSNAVAARRQPRRVLKVLARALRNSHVIAGRRGEATDVAAALVTAP